MSVSLIPESAPFNTEQRAWLNGFFAGLLNVVDQSNPRSGSDMASAAVAAIAPLAGLSSTELASPTVPVDANEDFAWHDESLSLDERMQLAEGQPLNRRLMAAMAQLDCGSCGYLCKTYSEAIASGTEKNLTLCSPGGKETKQMIKLLVKEGIEMPAKGTGAPANGSKLHASDTLRSNGHSGKNGSIKGETPVPLQAEYSRQNPFHAKLVESRRLNREGSAKHTRHVVIDLAGSNLKYEVGDALGILPTNCDELAEKIVKRLQADARITVITPLGNSKTFRQALCEDCCLKDPGDELIELLIDRISHNEAKGRLRKLLDEGAPEGFDVLDALDIAKDATVTATEIIELLSPLNPRLYSIASSMKRVGDQVHLTVGKVQYDRDGRVRKGVASTLLADRMNVGDTLRVFTQPNHGGFTVPKDPSTPMIMIGPGTGIAPFVAFLQEREATHAPGKNWLFFGDQRESHDYLYQDELNAYVRRGLLTKLDTAFSRDGDSKVYVQDRMREKAAELWKWLEAGSHFYVCGDASRMASDVDRTLQSIISQQGAMSNEAAKAYVTNLSKTKRYVRDVY